MQRRRHSCAGMGANASSSSSKVAHILPSAAHHDTCKTNPMPRCDQSSSAIDTCADTFRAIPSTERASIAGESLTITFHQRRTECLFTSLTFCCAAAFNSAVPVAAQVAVGRRCSPCVRWLQWSHCKCRATTLGHAACAGERLPKHSARCRISRELLLTVGDSQCELISVCLAAGARPAHRAHEQPHRGCICAMSRRGQRIERRVRCGHAEDGGRCCGCGGCMIRCLPLGVEVWG